MAALCALTALLSAAGSPLPPFPAAPRGTPNMNGEYTDSSGATLPHFADYPRPTAYFDAWSPPFSTLYSQVWWTALAPLAIPKAVSDRYANGGVMAIVGVEMDQVRRVDNVSAHDVSVPINMAYNHHWTVTISGSKSTRERVQFGEGDDRSEFDDGHGVPDVVYRHAPLPELAKDCRSGHCAVCPSKQAQSCATKIGLGGGNGGEMRKTWHGLPAGYARPLLEPSHVQVTPMQIDTWWVLLLLDLELLLELLLLLLLHRLTVFVFVRRNRDAMKLGGGSAFVSGPTPRTCLSPTSGPDALYSGLLECPLTTRITKNIQSDYTAHSAGASGCEHDIMTAAECFSAVPKALGACCGSCGSCSISWLAENKRNLGRQRIVESADAPVGCSMLRGAAVGIDGRGAVDILFNMAKTSETSCGDHAAEVRGTQTYTHAKTGSAPLVNVTISLHPQAQTATITMSGPASVWFGTGFGSSNMKGTYAIVVDGSGKVTERTLGDHTAGALLPPSVSLRSSKVAGASRVVVLRRPMRAADPRGFSFSANSSVLPLIDAVGSTKQFAHHKAKTAASAVLLPVDAPSAQRQVGGACVCAAKPPPFGAGVGTFTYTPNATQKVHNIRIPAVNSLSNPGCSSCSEGREGQGHDARVWEPVLRERPELHALRPAPAPQPDLRRARLHRRPERLPPPVQPARRGPRHPVAGYTDHVHAQVPLPLPGLERRLPRRCQLLRRQG